MNQSLSPHTKKNIMLMALMTGLSLVVYAGVGVISNYLMTNLFAPAGTEVENLSITMQNDIEAIDEDNDRLSIDFYLSFSDNPDNVNIDGLVIEMIFPAALSISNLNIINLSEGVQFDQVQNVPVDDGQKIVITFLSLNLSNSGQLFSFQVDLPKIEQDFDIETQGEILTQEGQEYTLTAFDYTIDTPSVTPDPEPEPEPEPAPAPAPTSTPSPSQSSSSGGGGGGSGGGISRKKEDPKPLPVADNTTPLVEDDIYAICSISYKPPFSDIEEHFAKPSIGFLHHLAIVNGYAGNVFKPNQNIIRAEVTKMVVTTFKNDLAMPSASELGNIYPDVFATDWYASFIRIARTYGIVNGYKDGLFKPVKNMTRAEALKVMMLAADWKITSGYPAVFPDVSKDSWYYDIVNYAYGSGVVKGYVNNKFGPDDLITRGQTAVILKNIICSPKTALLKTWKTALSKN